MANGFSQGIERPCHGYDLEQNKNIVKCLNGHETLQALVFKAFCALRRFVVRLSGQSARSLKINYKSLVL